MICISSCKDNPTSSLSQNGILYVTNKTNYYFSTVNQKDTIWYTIINGSDSTIYYWTPAYHVAYKDISGNWILKPYSHMYHTNVPILPGMSFTSYVFAYVVDSTDLPGEYSFYGGGFRDTTKYLFPQVSVQSNSFKLENR